MAMFPDDRLENADWTKGTWDLLHITNREELLEHIRRSGMSVEDFKRLPVYLRNRDSIPFLREI